MIRDFFDGTSKMVRGFIILVVIIALLIVISLLSITSKPKTNKYDSESVKSTAESAVKINESNNTTEIELKKTLDVTEIENKKLDLEAKKLEIELQLKMAEIENKKLETEALKKQQEAKIENSKKIQAEVQRAKANKKKQEMDIYDSIISNSN